MRRVIYIDDKKEPEKVKVEEFVAECYFNPHGFPVLLADKKNTIINGGQIISGIFADSHPVAWTRYDVPIPMWEKNSGYVAESDAWYIGYSTPVHEHTYPKEKKKEKSRCVIL